MECYTKSDRFLEAAAVGEHLIYIHPAGMSLHREMVQLYISLAMTAKIRSHLTQLIDLLAQKQQWYEIKEIVAECTHVTDINGRVQLYADIIIHADKVGCPSDVIIICIERILHDLSLVDNKKSIHNFMSLLQAYSEKLYHQALTYLKK